MPPIVLIVHQPHKDSSERKCFLLLSAFHIEQIHAPRYIDQLSSPSTSPPGASQLSVASPIMDLIAEEACHLLHSAGNHVALLHCMDHVDCDDDGQGQG